MSEINKKLYSIEGVENYTEVERYMCEKDIPYTSYDNKEDLFVGESIYDYIINQSNQINKESENFEQFIINIGENVIDDIKNSITKIATDNMVNTTIERYENKFYNIFKGEDSNE